MVGALLVAGVVLLTVLVVAVVALVLNADRLVESVVFGGSGRADPPDELHTWFLRLTDGTHVQLAATAAAGATDTLLVYFHGNGDTLASCAAKLKSIATTSGAVVVSFDYRGYGASEGRPTQATLAADALAVVQEAEARFTPRHVVLYGFSLGGYAAVHAAAARPDVCNLFLEAPFLGSHATRVPCARWLDERFGCAGALAALRGKHVACVLASGDAIIDNVAVRALLLASGATIKHAPGGHVGIDETAVWQEAMSAWLANLSSGDGLVVSL
jgi:pimeloyl-ACP methyl ester carboxylesterase